MATPGPIYNSLQHSDFSTPTLGPPRKGEGRSAASILLATAFALRLPVRLPFHQARLSHVPARSSPRPHRCRSRRLARTSVRLARDSVDLHRSGLQGRLPQGRAMAGGRAQGLRHRRKPSRDRRTSGGGRACKGRGQAACAVLRPLRRAAGRSAEPVGDAALRAAGWRPCRMGAR